MDEDTVRFISESLQLLEGTKGNPSLLFFLCYVLQPNVVK